MDRVLIPVASAGTFAGMSLVTLSQSVFNPIADTAERLIGGSVLFAAAFLIVRWTFRLLKEQREHAAEQREAALVREKALLAQLERLARQLNAERSLRISLEQAGIADRRRHLSDLDPPLDTDADLELDDG